MLRVSCHFFLLAASFSIAADQPKFPDWPIEPKREVIPSPMPRAVIALKGEDLYVIQGDGNEQVLSSPPGVVSITEEAGPIRIRGRFVDSNGKVETRVYDKKQVFIVERLLAGQFELLKIPKGTVERRLITDGQPVPPEPLPPDPKPPAPTKPVIDIDGVSVLLLYESADLAKMTKEQAAIPYSTRLYTYLDSACAMHPNGKVKAWAIWDKDVDGYLDSKAFGDAQARKRDGIPWAIISSRNGSYEGPWPKDDLAMIELVKKTIATK